MTAASSPYMEGRDVRALLRQVAERPGVRGALLVAPDGLVIASDLPEAIAVEAISALAATLGRELELRASLPDHGAFALAHFASEHGTLVLGATAIGFVVVLATDAAERASLAEVVRSAVAAVERAWRVPAGV